MDKFPKRRPAKEDRCFSSKAVEEKIKEVVDYIQDEELAWLFNNCYPNTLDTTVNYKESKGEPDSYVITGDIDAMWLRDSTAQVWPYLPLINEDQKLRKMIKGLIRRQAEFVLRDPYANAFYWDGEQKTPFIEDQPKPKPGVHERKWEIDSLCAVVRLIDGYYQQCQDQSIFTDELDQAMRLIYKTFKTEQRKNDESDYFFVRETTEMIESATFNGTGRPTRKVGLIHSAFRPSDDATLFSYLIPSNLFAVSALRKLNKLYSEELADEDFAASCNRLADEVETAVEKYGMFEHLDYGKIYAYEVDGFGNRLFMDDANVPSLISLNYLGIHEDEDEIYKNTRNFLLSDDNPFFLKGEYAEGQGSPHSGKKNIWPMGIILRALTSSDKEEIIRCLKMLKSTHAETGFMHESFNKDNPAEFTRDWFAWANTLFGELILKIYNENKEILNKI